MKLECSDQDYQNKRQSHHLLLTKQKWLVKEGNLAKAALVIYKEKAALQQRNNILKIADPQGWDTVNDYLDDPTGRWTEDAAVLRSLWVLKKGNAPSDRPKGGFAQ